MPQYIWVPRSEWGSSSSTESFIQNRVKDEPQEKTEIHVHHTAGADTDDSTPNRWDYEEATAYMRRLQWVRPELGPLPYSENYAVSEDAQTVWILEGRGILTRGAHTGGHNVSGVGFGVLGNFNYRDEAAAEAVVGAIEHRVAYFRKGLTPFLGDTKSPNGWNAWGHRDSKSTSCPGAWLYPLLANFSLEEDMAKPTMLDRAVIHIIFEAFGAQGDPTYWYNIDVDSTEFQNLIDEVKDQDGLIHAGGGTVDDHARALANKALAKIAAAKAAL